MERKLDLILNELQNLNNKVTNIEKDISTIKSEQQSMKRAIFETGDRTSRMEEKLSSVGKQLAQNTEQGSKISDLSKKVHSHDADIKLIKRVLTN